MKNNNCHSRTGNYDENGFLNEGVYIESIFQHMEDLSICIDFVLKSITYNKNKYVIRWSCNCDYTDMTSGT